MTVVSTNKPTAEQARQILLGLAIGQTAYGLNNGGGPEVNQPLRFIEDSTLIKEKGALPLKLTVEDGYTVIGIYRDDKSGLDVLMAFNKEKKSFILGFAGTNGVGQDKADTQEDLIHLGARQNTALFSNKNFKKEFTEAANSIGGTENIKEVIFAGQSLAGATSTLAGYSAIFGNPKDIDPETNGNLGLKAEQVTIVGINPLGSSYALKAAGFSQKQIDEFNEKSSQYNLVTRNTETGAIDLISQIGGGRAGQYYELPVKNANSIIDLHRFNFGVAEGLENIEYDLTRLNPISVDTLSHGTISSNMKWLDSNLKLANNNLSVAWGMYVSTLFSRPGEAAAFMSNALQRSGTPKILADGMGLAGELLVRAIPVLNVARAAQLLFSSFALGQAIGSENALEVKFPELQAGWTRKDFLEKNSDLYAQGWRIIIDENPVNNVRIVRYGNGNTQEIYPDGVIISKHPRLGTGVFSADGSGTLYLNRYDAKIGETTFTRVSLPPGTAIELVADGWRTTRRLDDQGLNREVTYYSGNNVSVFTERYKLDENGKAVLQSSISSRYVLPADFSIAETAISWKATRTEQANGHMMTVVRDGNLDVVEMMREEKIDEHTRKITFIDKNSTITGTRLETQLNENSIRVENRDASGKITDTCITTKIYDNDQILQLENFTDYKNNICIIRTIDSNGEIRQIKPVSLNAEPAALSEAAKFQIHTDVADFLTALRQRDKAGMLLSSARLVLDYARTQGVVTTSYDGVVSSASNGLTFINSLRSIQSGDTLAKVGGTVGLLNSTHYFADKFTGTRLLSESQMATLNTIGAVLAIANLANLGKMIENRQFGSASASVISAINSLAYLTNASTAFAGAGAFIAINPIVMVVAAFVLDEFFAEDPPPPPPQGLATIIRLADGSLGFRLSENNDLGAEILNKEMAKLLPELEKQLAQVNKNISDPDHAFQLIASRMPTIRLSSWPSRSENGVSNYFFVLEQTDPMRDDPNYIGIARQDLQRLYAETLLLPEALCQQWEIDHLIRKFGTDEAHWQTEGEWLRGQSPIEKQRSLLQQDYDQSLARWKAISTVRLAVTGLQDEGIIQGNIRASLPQEQETESARLKMEAAKSLLDTFMSEHPESPQEAARATPEQEQEFARRHQARQTVSMQWLKVIAVDLGDDGVEINDLPGEAGTDLNSLRQQRVARFDVDGDGYKEATQWLAASEAMLCIDRSGNGLIDNGSELFNGSDSPL